MLFFDFVVFLFFFFHERSVNRRARVKQKTFEEEIDEIDNEQDKNVNKVKDTGSEDDDSNIETEEDEIYKLDDDVQDSDEDYDERDDDDDHDDDDDEDVDLDITTTTSSNNSKTRKSSRQGKHARKGKTATSKKNSKNDHSVRVTGQTYADFTRDLMSHLAVPNSYRLSDHSYLKYKSIVVIGDDDDNANDDDDDDDDVDHDDDDEHDFDEYAEHAGSDFEDRKVGKKRKYKAGAGKRVSNRKKRNTKPSSVPAGAQEASLSATETSDTGGRGSTRRSRRKSRSEEAQAPEIKTSNKKRKDKDSYNALMRQYPEYKNGSNSTSFRIHLVIHWYPLKSKTLELIYELPSKLMYVLDNSNGLKWRFGQNWVNKSFVPSVRVAVGWTKIKTIWGEIEFDLELLRKTRNDVPDKKEWTDAHDKIRSGSKYSACIIDALVNMEIYYRNTGLIAFSKWCKFVLATGIKSDRFYASMFYNAFQIKGRSVTILTACRGGAVLKALEIALLKNCLIRDNFMRDYDASNKFRENDKNEKLLYHTFDRDILASTAGGWQKCKSNKSINEDDVDVAKGIGIAKLSIIHGCVFFVFCIFFLAE